LLCTCHAKWQFRMCSGAIGTAAWTGVLLRDVLDRCSNLPLLGEEGSAIEDLCAQYVILRGRDMHTKGRQRYESALPIAKVLDPRCVGQPQRGPCPASWRVHVIIAVISNLAVLSMRHLA
jgi:DMSO/TMAO reductase YedYZ molybdopterin-dependent catalytic subunit